jgi:hypothetical protein
MKDLAVLRARPSLYFVAVATAGAAAFALAGGLSPLHSGLLAYALALVAASLAEEVAAEDCRIMPCLYSLPVDLRRYVNARVASCFAFSLPFPLICLLAAWAAGSLAPPALCAIAFGLAALCYASCATQCLLVLSRYGRGRPRAKLVFWEVASCMCPIAPFLYVALFRARDMRLIERGWRHAGSQRA